MFSGLVLLLSFQNCSNDASFQERPSTDRTAIPGPGDVGGNGIAVGGDSDVVIRFNEVPTDTTQGNDAVVDYEVTSPNGTITEVRCSINGQNVDCGTSGRIPITNSPLGENQVEITATDNNGNTVTEIITWTVYRNLVKMERPISVTASGDSVDIIINIDNSGSMEYEQTQMANKVANFMAPFAGLNYNIAITTTSPIGDDIVWKESLDYVDGKFIPLKDSSGVMTGDYCIRSADNGMTTTRAQELISANVVRGLYLLDDNGDPMPKTYLDDQGNVQVARDGNGNIIYRAEGNGWERGIFTTYRAFERDLGILDSQAQPCMRNGVPKHVILISDERETLFEPKANASDPTIWLPQQEKSGSAEIRALVASGYGDNTVFKFHSIIVNPYTDEGAACLASYGARPGVEYAQLSVDTGGYIGSVCADDYSAQLGQIGQIISDSALSYPLGCIAVANGGTKGVVNDSGGNPVGVNYSFVGDKVEFAQLLPVGDYVAEFWCYQ